MARRISVTDLNGVNGFRIPGLQQGDFNGSSVAGGLDFNGDGLNDILISAPGTESGGSAYILYGSRKTLGATFDLADMSSGEGLSITGIPARTLDFKFASALGDVDGDGLDDIAVARDGSSFFSFPDIVYHPDSAYIVYGQSGRSVATVDLGVTSTNVFSRIDGDSYFSHFGEAISGAGDFNGDGLADFVIGDNNFSTDGISRTGAAYVFLGGQRLAPSSAMSDQQPSLGLTIYGDSGQSVIGGRWSLSYVENFNGDKYSDLIISDFRGDTPTKQQAGLIYVVFGGERQPGGTLDVASLDGTNGFVIQGAQAYGGAGLSVASAGDVNGDGYEDLIIGAPLVRDKVYNQSSGTSYLIYGSGDPRPPVIDLARLGSAGTVIEGDRLGQNGYSVSSAGDFNGDGYDDVIIGSPNGYGEASGSGASVILFGKEGGFGRLLKTSTFDSLTFFEGLILEGLAWNDEFGGSVSALGDINGDGLSDVVVGAEFADPNGIFGAGEAYVYFGLKPDAAVVRNGTIADQTLAGGEFADTLSGLGGSDKLYGNGGSDVLRGGDGDDVLFGGRGADVLSGGLGLDKASYRFSDAAIRIALSNGAGVGGDAEGDRFMSIENVDGSELSDVIRGDSKANHLFGWAGQDKLFGGSGDDRLSGGSHADTLDGGQGADILTGGGQNDLFVFSSLPAVALPSAVPDIITDFRTGDRIDLRAIDADVDTAGNQAFSLLEGATFSSTAQVIWSRQAGGTVVQLDVNADLQADLVIFLENWNRPLAASDFFL